MKNNWRDKILEIESDLCGAYLKEMQNAPTDFAETRKTEKEHQDFIAELLREAIEAGIELGKKFPIKDFNDEDLNDNREDRLTNDLYKQFNCYPTKDEHQAT